MMEVLKKLDRKFSDQIGNFYKTNNIQNKKQALSNLVEYIYKKSKGSLPSKWFLKD